DASPPRCARARVGPRVPEPHRAVEAAGQKELAVRREGYMSDRRLVPFEDLDERAGLRLPEPHRLVLAGRGEEISVRRKRGLPDLVRVPFEDTARAGRHVPEPRG